jgi:hypothetical protein
MTPGFSIFENKLILMKTYVVLFILIFCSFISSAQSLADVLTKKPVKSVEWFAKSTVFAEGFWDMVAPQLEKQFTKKLADSIVTYSSPKHFPGGFKDVPKEQVKLYWVTSFENNFHGKYWGTKYILMVPYAENKDLWKNTQTPPNDFFLVFSKESVVLGE